MMLVGDKANDDAEPLIEDILNANLVSEQGCMREGGGSVVKERERSGVYEKDNMSRGRFVGVELSASKGEDKVHDEAQRKQHQVECLGHAQMRSTFTMKLRTPMMRGQRGERAMRAGRAGKDLFQKQKRR
ncbi:hypothetical protein PIB30_018664 [Stylosanthes scabra]|uniref:Uncharacterized protein n=1 Tax=Stylosanthes scabra TaxID=79078 RepID=A0ABU6V858_9FABA|nr:hypothetical protein [Stylosanthes scabra]